MELYHLFEEAAKKFTTKDAVICFDGQNMFSCSYKDLLEASCIICRQLQEQLNNPPYCERQIIAISFLDQSNTYIAVLLGILKNGSAFLFLPSAELSVSFSSHGCCSNLNVKFVFVPKSSSDNLDSNFKVIEEFQIFGRIILLCKWEGENCPEETQLAQDFPLAPIVYAIQTSGTTGCKKIIRVTQNSIFPNIHDFVKIFCVDEHDSVLLSAPFTFDPSIIDIFIALTTGATLITLADSVKSYPPFLLDVLFPIADSPDLLNGHKLTVLQITPSLFQRWTQSEIRSRILTDDSSLRVLALGGEECIPLKILKSYKSERNNTEIFNLYGLTEISCWASCFKISLDESENKSKIPLGNPLTDTYLKVDANQEEFYDAGNQIGELIVGTRERLCFVNNESLPARERKTGDLVKFSNGNFYFVGRKDRVAKFYGTKVNLQEIEDAMNDFSSVSTCHCVYEPKSCILYILLRLKIREDQNEISNLRSHFCRMFGHSVPPFYKFILVEEFPVTCNGKFCEEEMLKTLVSNQTKNKRTLILRDTLKKFRDVWLSFGLRTQGGFKDLGGSSLSAIEITSILNNKSQSKKRFKLLNLLLSNGSFIECLKLLKNITIKNKNIRSRVKLKQIYRYKYSSLILHEQKHKFKKSLFYLSPRKMRHSQKLYFKAVYFRAKNVKLLFKKNRHIFKSRRKAQKTQDCGSVIARGLNFSCDFLTYLKASEFDDFDQLKISVAWKKDLMSCVDSSPAVLHTSSHGSHVVVSAHHGTFSSFKALSGDLLTSYNFKSDLVSSTCISSSSSGSESFSFIGCFDGRFCKINNFSGKCVWCFKSQSLIKARAVQVASYVYFASYDLNLYCLNEQTGKLKWKLFVGHKGIHANLLSIEKHNCICVCTLSGHVYMVDIRERRIKWMTELADAIFSSPCYFEGCGYCVVASVKGLCVCLNDKTGQKIWSLELNQPVYADVVNGPCEEIKNTFLCATQDGTIFCYEITNGSPAQQWKINLNSKFCASPFIFPLSCKQSSQIFFAVILVSTSGSVSLISLNDGEKLGELALPGEVFSSPVVYVDRIFVGCRDNNFYCLKIEKG